MKTVKIKIKKDGSGKVDFDLDGFVGTECDIVREIEASLGDEVNTEQKAEAFIDDNEKPAYNELS